MSKQTQQSRKFLEALGARLGDRERLILCGFTGDPYAAPMNAWKPHPWRSGQELPFGPRHNGYVTVASFGQAQDSTYRRRTETFAGGLALMVDDVGEPGDGSSARVDRELIAGFAPSARVLTSPGNEQWWYFLKEPCRDAALFDGLIRAFISGKLLGADPGMSGITRVGRMPGFLNAKKKYGGEFVCELVELNDNRFSPQELLDGFGLKINGRNVQPKRLIPEDAIERNRAFVPVYRWLQQRGMLKRDSPDASGWTEMTCINVDNHTNQVDNGAAIAEPSETNGFYGGFRCHHGGCTTLAWKELTDWVNEQSAEELERINAAV